MKILALSPNYKYHQDLLESLLAKGIETEFATSHKPESESINRPFYAKHKTKLINGKDFYNLNKLQKIVPADAPALDKEKLEYFESVERDFYTLSDRYSYFPKSFRYRKRLFRAGLRYWLDFYAKNKIDALFSICTPHNFPDYLAFHAAKYLGIKTLLTTDAMVNDHVLLLEDYRQSFKVPEDFMAGKSDNDIKASLKPSFAKSAFSESNEITMAKQWNDQMLKLKGVNAQVAKTDKLEPVKKFAKRATKFLSFEMFKPKFKATFAMNGEFSDNTRRLIRIQSGRRLKRLKKAYEDLAVYPDYSKKFAYFAMHLNPERTTQPEAEVFEDHLLAIEILSKSVPKDWLVYVKENPAQYGRKLNLVNGRHYRDASDYAEFTRLSNVRLLRQDVKTADLIKNATLVASLKGTVGWERINSGRACLIFANAWYSACRAAYRVNDLKSCKAAIKTILAKTISEVETDRLKFFAYMQDNIIQGSMGGHHNLKIAVTPYETMVDSLADSIIARFNAGSA